MTAASIKLRNKLNPKEFARETLVEETYEQGVVVKLSDCNACKQAICLSNGVFCGKLREHVNSAVSCPHFDLEPLEYRLYRRS